MSDKTQYELWAADPHQFGPGKIHIVDSEAGTKDDARTLCGKWLRAVPGELKHTGRATCKICLNAVENRAHREIQRVEWDKQARQIQAQREAENRAWWANYNRYLNSPQWRERRRKVFQRANGTCECCLERPAMQVHHTTYQHVGNEPLWELKAICSECHESLTESDRAKRSA